MDTEGEIHGQHCAFLVSEEEFDLILGRLRDDGRQWWADPFKGQPHEINHEGRWPRPLLGGPGRALAGDHHLSVRQRRVMSGPLHRPTRRTASGRRARAFGLAATRRLPI
jgi:hypothetical protein